MNHNQRRFLSEDILSKIPPGVNPFQYLIDLAAPALSYSLSTPATRYILWVLFVLHGLIVLFCPVILSLLYQRGVKQFLWLVRRLDIEDKNGKNVPLFLVNTNVLIPITQSMGSLASQGYILLVIKNVTTSQDRTTHTILTTMMLVMFTCEIMTYWFLSHCFLVAIYSSYRNRKHVSKGPRKWMPSPILINAVFFIFPVGVLAASITVFTRLTLILNPFIDEVVQVMEALREGSSIWEQLKILSISTAEKSELVTNLAHVVARAESLGQNLNIHFHDVLNWFMMFQWVMLALVCVAALVFVLVFCQLAQRFHEQGPQSSTSSVSQSSPVQLRSWNSQEDPSNIMQQRSHHTNRTFIDTVRSNQQFFHLIVRALCIVIAMLTTMTNLILGIVANERSLTNPQILRVLVWLVTASGTWSAIPISWHCWRLYKDKLGGTLLTSTSTSTRSKEVALTVYRNNVPPEQSFERVIDEIKVERGFQTRSTLNFSKALEDLSSARYSHGEYSLKNLSS